MTRSKQAGGGQRQAGGGCSPVKGFRVHLSRTPAATSVDSGHDRAVNPASLRPPAADVPITSSSQGRPPVAAAPTPPIIGQALPG